MKSHKRQFIEKYIDTWVMSTTYRDGYYDHAKWNKVEQELNEAIRKDDEPSWEGKSVEEWLKWNGCAELISNSDLLKAVREFADQEVKKAVKKAEDEVAKFYEIDRKVTIPNLKSRLKQP
jgi:hypothetical protein